MTLEKKYKLNFLWKTNKPIPKLPDGRTGGRKDGRMEGRMDRSLIHRTLIATVGGPKSICFALISERIFDVKMSFHELFSLRTRKIKFILTTTMLSDNTFLKL